MAPHRLEVADVFRKHGGAYLAEHGVSAEQRRVMRQVSICRTAALGGHVKRCDHCAHEEFFYKSCGNRHCPKCQGAARAKWLEDRAADLLGTRYFHVVFTLPSKLGPIALQNKRVVYGILFRAASETLLEIARDPKHLGAEIGFLAVLHTWGQRVNTHPHIHCVVPGGGLSPDAKSWISSRKNFFVHVKVLSKVFRGKISQYLSEAFKRGELSFHGKLDDLGNPRRWWAELASLKKRDFVVYAKRPFGSATLVLKYLARYTHRVAISNSRLISMENGKVTFRWKDYAKGSQQKEMTLEAHEFIRRFLLHVLPRGFQRIRHYGFLSNRVRKKKLQLCRELLGQREDIVAPPSQEHFVLEVTPTKEDKPETELCSACKKGRLHLVCELKPDWRGAQTVFEPQGIDSS